MPMTETAQTEFERELEQLINNYSIENESDTPDFILARFVRHCLDAWNVATKARKEWHGNVR